MATKEPDCDDLPVIDFNLADPHRISQLEIKGEKPVLIEEVHAFLWLQRAWFKYKAAPVRMQTKRLLGEWLKMAEFDKDSIC